jgi:hypothetical protein
LKEFFPDTANTGRRGRAVGGVPFPLRHRDSSVAVRRTAGMGDTGTGSEGKLTMIAAGYKPAPPFETSASRSLAPSAPAAERSEQNRLIIDGRSYASYPNMAYFRAFGFPRSHALRGNAVFAAPRRETE